jgi:uncharacterized protein (DUF2252 family)
MADNAFGFFRGTCHLFYEDLGRAAALPGYPLTWICGDLHLENFGSYKADNRLVYFDLNDFDEGLLAPVHWELARMVSSIFTGLAHLRIRRKEATQVAKLFLKTYSETLAKGRARYVEPQTARGIVRLFLDKVCERRLKELLGSRTVRKKGKLLLLKDEKRFFRIDGALRASLSAHVNEWIRQSHGNRFRYRVVDACFRIAGTGSIGVKRYVFLARNLDEPKKHVLIEMKESLASSVQPWLDTPQPAWASEAGRVVGIQERMQNMSPALLDSTLFEGHPYVIREMQPTEDKIDFLLIRNRPKDIIRVVADMALLAASAQLRSSGRQGAAVADELIAFGQDAHWQKPLLDYAGAYARQVKKDWLSYRSDYKAGFFL